MKHTYLLSEDTKNYLCCYYQTLDGMIQAMTTASLTQNISHDLIAQMIPHHRSAVQTSNNILRFSENMAVRRLAQRSIDEHTQRIGQMETALETCGRSTAPQVDLRLYRRRMDLICRKMYAEMGSIPENDRLDAVFLRGSIPHRLGAVRMAENALKYDISVELVPILRSIATQQRREIAQMRTLLSRIPC